MDVFDFIERDRLIKILNHIGGVSAGMVGDICLDAYWRADMRLSELSRETPHFPLPIVEERYGAGGGANVAANITALRPKRTRVFGVVGDDWRGGELKKILTATGADVSNIITAVGRVTNAYIKPIRQGISDVSYEDPRLDFTDYAPLMRETEEIIIAALDDAAGSLDVLCVSDQMPDGVITARVREHICLLAERGLRVVADSRSRIGTFRHVTIKPNELEGAFAAGLDPEKIKNIEDCASAARVLSEKINGGVFMTLGASGSLYADASAARHIPARKVGGPIDICGAGDTSLAGFSLAFAAGAEPHESAFIAGLCSEISIRQIGATGTASREQIIDWYGQNFGG